MEEEAGGWDWRLVVCSTMSCKELPARPPFSMKCIKDKRHLIKCDLLFLIPFYFEVACSGKVEVQGCRACVGRLGRVGGECVCFACCPKIPTVV